MGQAKSRGTLAERKEQAHAAGRIKEPLARWHYTYFINEIGQTMQRVVVTRLGRLPVLSKNK